MVPPGGIVIAPGGICIAPGGIIIPPGIIGGGDRGMPPSKTGVLMPGL
jgi:hypothetical protein